MANHNSKASETTPGSVYLDDKFTAERRADAEQDHPYAEFALGLKYESAGAFPRTRLRR